MAETIKGRGVGIIIKDNRILLMRRVRNGQKYFVFPGGAIEENETPEEATVREVMEELTLEAKIDKFLFKMFNPGPEGSNYGNRDDYFFLITEFTGEVRLGGPELEKMNENDQFYPEWYDLEEAKKFENLFPQKAKEKLFELLANEKNFKIIIESH